MVLTGQHPLTTAVQVTSAIGAVISILSAVAIARYFEADRQGVRVRMQVSAPT
jgi:hypothetical protein